MKIKDPVNSNYSAVVCQIKQIDPIPNKDRIVSTKLIGYASIVGADTQLDSVGIVFPPETQLSNEFCKYNNLYRDETRNADRGKNGYLDDNRRVKAIKFAGQRSECLYLPLTSLAFTGVNTGELKVGDTFDQLNGVEICNKYERVLPDRRLTGKGAYTKPQFHRVDSRVFQEHMDTANYFRMSHTIKDDDSVIITQKLHGSSVRFGRVPVARKLSLYERLLKKLGANIELYEYKFVVGSHHVIKSIN